MTIAREYAEYCASIEFDDIPADVVDHAKKLTLDILANAIGGYVFMDSGETFAAAARRLDGRSRDEHATVFATGDRVGAAYASLANGAMSHSLDYDNHHAEGVVHIGSSVVNAGLAAAEAAGADGAELLTAITAGYEVTARLGIALNPFNSHNLGFHPTATCGTFGSTATVGRIRGLDADTLEDGFGFNGSQAAGSMQYDANGAWNKRAHPGLAAHNAFVAAAMVEEGLVGAYAPIEGEDGFLQGYSMDPRPELATRALGAEFELAKTAIKPYPLCRYTHLALDLLLGMVDEAAFEPDEVEAVTVEMPEYGVNLVGRPEEAKRHPTSSVDAQFSMPFAVALALTRGDAGMQTFRDAVRTDGDYDAGFQRLMDATTVRVSDDIEAKHPEKWPARVTVHTAAGDHERYGENTKGEPGDPMSWDEIAAKFAELTPEFDRDEREAIVEVVRDLENRTVEELVGQFPTVLEASR